MKKRLLMIGLLATSLSMMAQDIFNFGFETPSSDLTVGKLEFVNFLAGDTRDSMNIVTAHSGTNALMLQNANTTAGANYQRALKFRNLPIEANTSYRLTFWVKGNNTYTLAGATTTSTSNIRARMEVGKENADVAFLGANNTAFDYNFTGFDPANWVKKSAVFFYADDAVHQAYYKTLNPDSADLTSQYFLNLNVFNPGTYYIDDVSVKKSTIRGISYNGDVINVDFGYAINGEALRAGKDYSTAVLPIECVNVMLDGVKQDVEAVEVQASGFLIFLATAYLDDSAEGKLKISFTNPTSSAVALKYTAALRPNAWDANSDMMVKNFTDEDCNYDMNLTGSSTIYSAPFLKSATPEDGSFSLPYNTRSFQLVYSKKVDCSTVTASLAGPNAAYQLNLVETGYSNTLTFNVKAADVLSDLGEYFLTVKNITSEMGTPAPNTVISLEYGIPTAGVIDTLYNSEKSWAANANGSVPNGFKRITGTAVVEQNVSIGSNRMFTFPAGGEYTRGVYLCYRDGVKTDFIYGLYPEQRLHMKPGKYNFTVRTNQWQQSNKKIVNFSLAKLDTVAIYSKELTGGSQLANASSAVTGSVVNSANFTITEENDYLMDFGATAAQGWDALILGKILLIKTPSTSFLYSSNLDIKLNSAIATRTSMDSSIYDGVDKIALSTVIQKYVGFTGTSPSVYSAAIADVDSFIVKGVAYKAKVDAHFASIITYNTNFATAKTTRDTYAGTNYATLSCYPKLVDVVAFYEGKSLTNDDSLKVANDSLPFYTNFVKNMVGTAIPALTYRLKKAVTLARSLKVPVPEADLVAAEASFTDNDQIAHALLIKISQYLSHNLALDSLKLGSSVLDSTAKDSVEMTCYIKNPNFYTSKVAQGLDMTTYPGWVVSTVAGGGIYDLAATNNPVRDTYATVFNTKVDSFYQVVTGLPNGIYNVDMHVRTGAVGTTGVTQADIDKFLKFYVIHGTDTTNVGFIQAAFGLPAAYVSVRNVTVTDGTLTLGVKTTVSPFSGYTPSLFWGDPTLWLVGKAGTYTGTKEMATKATIKEVQYYTIQGFRMNAPGRGLNIVKSIYDNGSVKVEKVMIR